jgi:GTP-dependent phosphoenolpyruvate carboxykinase
MQPAACSSVRPVCKQLYYRWDARGSAIVGQDDMMFICMFTGEAAVATNPAILLLTIVHGITRTEQQEFMSSLNSIVLNGF